MESSAQSLPVDDGYAPFARAVEELKREVCHEIYRSHRTSIRLKKEEPAVARLVVIFEKTLEISNRTGFQTMSVRDLSEGTGISMGALYSYIESKERLLDMILMLGRRIGERVMNAQPAQPQRADARLRWLLRTHLYLTEALQPWFYFSFMESRYFGKEALRKAIDGELNSERRITQCLTAGVAEGVFELEQPELAAAVIKPMLQDWYLKPWKYRRRGITVDAYADFVIEFIETAVRFKPAAGSAAPSSA